MKVSNEQQPVDSGQWKPHEYDTNIAYVAQLGEPLLDWLNAQPGERIVDLGCGTGTLTAKIADSGAQTIGLDGSVAMVEAARSKYPQLHFEVADAEAFRLDEPVDAIFSNAVFHWIRNIDRAMACISAALKPGGRLVCEFGGQDNVAAINRAIRETLREHGLMEHASRNPWYFPSVAQFCHVVEQSGLRVRQAAHWERPTVTEDGVNGLIHWLDMFAVAFFNDVPPEQKQTIYRQIERKLEPVLAENGVWSIDYRRLRVLAVK